MIYLWQTSTLTHLCSKNIKFYLTLAKQEEGTSFKIAGEDLCWGPSELKIVIGTPFLNFEMFYGVLKIRNVFLQSL